MSRLIDLTGITFGRLTVLQRAIAKMWRMQCECGSTLNVNGQSLRTGNTRSCGCLKKDLAAERHTTHGMYGSTEYRSWFSMIQRCTNINHKHFPNYGGRGIRVCNRWHKSFSEFLRDMGMKPSPKHSIDRVNNDGNYEPGNCRWATRKQQSLNRRTSKTKVAI